MRRTRFVSVVGLLLGLSLLTGCMATQSGSASGESDSAATSASSAADSDSDSGSGSGDSGSTDSPEPSDTTDQAAPAPVQVTGRVQVDSTIPDNEVDFGTIPVGAGGIASVDVVNNQDSVMTIADLSVSGGSFELADDKCTGIDVQPGDSCPLTITVTPTSAAVLSGTLDITVSYELGLYIPLKAIAK